MHRDRGSKVVFVAGNREKLVPRGWQDRIQEPYPFTHLSREDWQLQWGQLKLGFIHGDAINTQDLRHLRWRAFSNSRGFETLFRIMPGAMARWIAAKVEAMLAGSNRKFKISFPDQEVENFAKQVLPGWIIISSGIFTWTVSSVFRGVRNPPHRPGLAGNPKTAQTQPGWPVEQCRFQEGVFQETKEDFSGQH